MYNAIHLAFLIYTLFAQILDENIQENFKLTEYRIRHRRTINGKLCASAFSQNEQRFTDCTITLTPDGTTTGKEWCYIEAEFKKEGEKPEWNYCRPYIDYNALRELAEENLRSKILDAEKLINKMNEDLVRINNIQEKYELICNTKLNETKYEIDQLDTLVEHIDHCVELSKKSSNTIKELENTVQSLQKSIDSQRQTIITDPHNCRQIQGYENDYQADGITGIYYNTLDFTHDSDMKVAKISRVDLAINFIWNNREPVPGINENEFSIRWNGFLAVPYSAEYRFHVKASCGARLYINKKLILVDRMPEDSYIPNDQLGIKSVLVLPPTKYIPNRVITSAPIYLTSTNKISLRLEYIHSKKLLYTNENEAFIQLLYSTNTIEAQIIPAEYFFQTNKQASLKISSLGTSYTNVLYTKRGMRAFLDNNNVYIGDLPVELEGSKYILMNLGMQDTMVKYDKMKGNNGNNSTYFTIKTNIQAELYVAYMNDIPMKLISAAKLNFVQKLNTYVGLYTIPEYSNRANEVKYFKISVMNLSPNILHKFEIKSAPLLIFVKGITSAIDYCIGETILLSDPTDANSEFQSCSASNIFSKEFDCPYAFNNVQSDEAYGTWKSHESGLGQSITINFKNPVRVSYFKYIPLPYPLMWPSELTLHFFNDQSDKKISPQSFSLVYNSGTSELSYNISPEVVTSIKTEITGMYANEQITGGNIQFFGTVCKIDNISTNNDEQQIIQKVSINSCFDNLFSLENLGALSIGNLIDIKCEKQCKTDSIGNLPVLWGTNIYIAESAICYAAIHAGVCKSNEICEATLLLLNGNRVHTGSTKFNITSYNHGHSDISFVVQPLSNIESTLTNKQKNNENNKLEQIYVFGQNISPSEDYIVDKGDLFDNNSKLLYTHGWLREPQFVVCNSSIDRYNINDVQQKRIHKGGISFPPAKSSPICQVNSNLCEKNNWTIIVKPNTLYSIVVQLGNPCNPIQGELKYYLSVNGVSIVNGLTLSAGEVYYAAVKNIVSNLNGRLIFDSVCDSVDCASVLTTIQQIKIIEE